MKTIICGAGVAGLTLAWCLQRAGHHVIVIDRNTELCNDGYMIDFFGSGYDASERLGLLARLSSIHHPVDRLIFVDADGKTRASLAYGTIRKSLFNDRHFNFTRGNLLRLLHDRVKGLCDIRLGMTLGSIERFDKKIIVRLNNQSIEEADVLIGADGTHSVVRRLAFGPEPTFGQWLKYKAAAFMIDDPSAKGRVRNDLLTLTVPNRQVSVYPTGDGRVAAFFLARSSKGWTDPSPDGVRKELSVTYGDLGWMVPELLRSSYQARRVHVDHLEQIRMPRWSSGRIVLVGDACQCVSLLGGQGASMAIAGVYVLAEELRQQSNIGRAFVNYECRVKPAIERQQRAAFRLGQWLIPSTDVGITIRDAITRTATWPSVASILRNRMAVQSVF